MCYNNNKKSQIKEGDKIMKMLSAIEQKDLETVIKDLPKEQYQEAYRYLKWLTAPDDQKYFWTKEWQQGEHEADEDIKVGRVKKFTNVNDLFADLDNDEE
jgi:hypothetical protein